MKKGILKIRRSLNVLMPMAVLLIGIIVMGLSTQSVAQASDPIPRVHEFRGEYSYDRENWQPLEGAELSARNKDVYLRGHWTDPIPEGTRLYFYSDHIGGELYIDGSLYTADLLLELDRYGLELQSSMCCRGWSFWYFDREVSAEVPVEIHLQNPHRFGNGQAYRVFVDTLRCTPNDPELMAKSLARWGTGFQVIGATFIIAALLLLGSSLTSIALRIPVGPAVTRLGLLVGFAGGFFLLDTVNLTFWSENNILNTYGWHICMMYGVYYLGSLTADLLSGVRARVASWALAASMAVNGLIVLLSAAGLCLIFDTLPVWALSQLMLCPVLAACCAGELFAPKKEKNAMLIFMTALFRCVVLDILGIGGSIYSRGCFTKAGLVLFFLYTFFRSVRSIIMDNKAADRARKLEKELEESRISIMLSQIQPHLIFNVLGTIRGLCREDPEQAWRGLGDFSNYLRGNMNALTNTRFIPFDTELRHVESYLRLEKMRLGDKLSIVYNIRERDFLIPPLTLQPLVENAVKHGIFYKAEGGTVIIHARQEDGTVILSVQDDGVGFAGEKPEPDMGGRPHIGLENVRSRVEKMLGGSLRIESVPNEGTTVTLEFPMRDHTSEGA